MEFRPDSPNLDAEEAVRCVEGCLEDGAPPPARVLQLLDDLRARFPTEARLRHAAGRVLESLGRSSEAEDEYREALRIDPCALEAALDLSELLLDAERPADAERLAAEAAANRPDARAFALLGEALKGLGRLAEAEAALRSAIQLDPTLTWAARELGEVLFDLARPHQALDLLHGLLDDDPVDPYNHGYLGDVLRRWGRPAEALEAFRTALWLEPGYAWAARQIAGIHFQRGELLAARKALETALAAEPEDALALTCLGLVERRRGNRCAAESHLRRAFELDPGADPAIEELVDLLREQGRATEAEEALRRRLARGCGGPCRGDPFGV